MTAELVLQAEVRRPEPFQRRLLRHERPAPTAVRHGSDSRKLGEHPTAKRDRERSARRSSTLFAYRPGASHLVCTDSTALIRTKTAIIGIAAALPAPLQSWMRAYGARTYILYASDHPRAARGDSLRIRYATQNTSSRGRPKLPKNRVLHTLCSGLFMQVKRLHAYSMRYLPSHARARKKLQNYSLLTLGSYVTVGRGGTGGSDPRANRGHRPETDLSATRRGPAWVTPKPQREQPEPASSQIADNRRLREPRGQAGAKRPESRTAGHSGLKSAALESGPA